MHAIDIANRQHLIPVDDDFLREVARKTLEAERAASAEISIALVDDEAIHALNRQHLGHDDPTDVLSFLFHSEPESPPDESQGVPEPDQPRPIPRGRGLTIDGEIVVSTETAARQAAECGWSTQDELTLYVVHGLLHLLGYDDQTDDERQLMRSRERAILGQWNLTPEVDG